MTRVCALCIGEDYLRQQIESENDVAECDFCNATDAPSIELEGLAELVHEALQKHFQLTSPVPSGEDYAAMKYGVWEQPGEPVLYVIAELIDSNEAIAGEIQEYLSNCYDPSGKDALENPCFYDYESHYEEKAIETYEFQESWDNFKREIISKARFFNQSAKELLEHIFEGVHAYETYDKQSVIFSLGKESSIYRARVATTKTELEEILINAPNSLGAPIGLWANAGRMNAEGISAFYGATDLETCIAEIRSPVGSHVISGTFYPLRDIRLLDLTKLRKVLLKGSFFDPDHSEALSRLQFLKRLEMEISKPVMPGSESKDYLPTQVVSEFLAVHPDLKLDGVIFSSSQINQIDEEDDFQNIMEMSKGSDFTEIENGRNIVLFPHASVLEKHSIPEGTKTEIYQSYGDPDDPDHRITIIEIEQPKSERKGQGSLFGHKIYPRISEHTGSGYDPSIMLDVDSMEVREIKGVVYQSDTITFSRTRLDSEQAAL